MKVVAVAVDDECEDTSAVVAIPPKRSTKGSRGSKKKVQRSGSNVFSAFSEKQLSEFKEAFNLMDDDKDGIISKSDLRATYNAVGRQAPADPQLEEMLAEATGPVSFTMFLTLFANRMSGGPADDDDVIVDAFKKFDSEGKIEAEKLRMLMMAFGDRFTEQEVNDFYDELDVDDNGRFETKQVITLLTGSTEEEEEEGNEEGEDEGAEVTFTL